ncbi:MAG: MFS transporter [Synergistales bacterium]|nr:MFS transporter [Synergistales bacterium]
MFGWNALPRESRRCFIASLFSYSCLGLFFLYPLVLSMRGMTPVKIGIAWTLFEVALLGTRPWSNHFIHRHGTRTSLVAGNALLVGGTLLLVATYLYPLIILGRCLQGVGWGIIVLANALHQARALPPEIRGRGFGIAGLAPLLPQIVVMPVGELLILAGHARATMLIALAGAVVAVFLTSRLAAFTDAEDERVSMWTAIRETHLSGPLAGVLLSGALFACSVAPIRPFIANAAQEWGTLASAFLWTSSLAAVGVRLFLADIVDRLGARLLLPSFGALMAGIIVATWGASTPAFLVGGLVNGVGMGISYPLLYTLLSRETHASRTTVTFTLFTAAMDVVWLTAPFTVTALAAFWSFGWILRGIGLAAGILVVLFQLFFWGKLTGRK